MRRKLGIVLALLGLGSGSVAAVAVFLFWVRTPMPITTLERPNLFDRMGEIPRVERPLPSSIVELASGLGYPYSLASRNDLFSVDPASGSFKRWEPSVPASVAIAATGCSSEVSLTWSGAAHALYLVAEQDFAAAAPARVFRLGIAGEAEEIAVPADADPRRRPLPDGGNTRLADPSNTVQVSWDGQSLVTYYLATELAERNEIPVRVSPLAGSGPARAFRLPVHDRLAGHLTWSQDGSWMAYGDTCGPCPWVLRDERRSKEPGCNDCVFRAGPEGETPRVLISGGNARWPEAGVRQIAISADGKRVAAILERNPGHLWVVDANGSGQRELPLPGRPGRPASATSLAWSPEGGRLAFLGDGFGEDHGGRDMLPFREKSIFVIGVDGSGIQRLSARTQCDGHLVWLP
jgi:hypothetical protein